MDAMIVFSSQIPSRGIINCRSGFYHLQTHGSISLMVPEATRYINTSQYVLYYLNAQLHATFFHLSSQLLFSLSFFGYVFFSFSPFCLFVSPVSSTFLRVILFLTESRHLTSGGRKKKIFCLKVRCVCICVCV